MRQWGFGFVGGQTEYQSVSTCYDRGTNFYLTFTLICNFSFAVGFNTGRTQQRSHTERKSLNGKSKQIKTSIVNKPVK